MTKKEADNIDGKFFEGLLILVFGVGLYSVFTERNLVRSRWAVTS